MALYTYDLRGMDYWGRTQEIKTRRYDDVKTS
jgi:hypothetical protein